MNKSLVSVEFENERYFVPPDRLFAAKTLEAAQEYNSSFVQLNK